jgi:hypothetical protein
MRETSGIRAKMREFRAKVPTGVQDLGPKVPSRSATRAIPHDPISQQVGQYQPLLWLWLQALHGVP